MDIIVNISIAVASGASGAALVYLASKTAITESIKGKIKSDNDHKLEGFKASLKGDYDSKIEQFKGVVQRDNLLLDTIFRTHNDISKTSHVKRVAAIEVFWSKYLVMNKSIASIAAVDSFLYVEEFASMLDPIPERQATVKGTFGIISNQTYESLFEQYDQIEAIRPFLNESIWIQITFFKIFCGRILYLHQKVYETNKAVHWKFDTAIMNLCKKHLTQAEYSSINDGEMGGINLVRSFVEQKLLKEISILLTGKSEMHDTIKHAKIMADLTKDLSKADNGNPFI